MSKKMNEKKQDAGMVIGKEAVRAAGEQLERWRREREPFHARIKDEENWYRLRVSPRPHVSSEGEVFSPRSAWLFNALMQKHADLMENIPTAVCLPREESDEADAEALSRILPVVFERSDFGEAFSENMWFKLKHGVCAWGVFFNTALENGAGDIQVRPVDMTKLYWQPDMGDIQHSSAVYVVERMDEDALRAAYPHYDGGGAPAYLSGFGGDGKDVTVVDWYYKKRLPDGRTVLHYCKFAGDTVLFASENEAAYEGGWYEHGMYPFVLDVLYPIKDTGLGFGVIALGRDSQAYIDRMDRNLLEYMDWATRVRYFCKRNTGLDANEFADISNRIVEVEGDLGEERLRQITVAGLDPMWRLLKSDKVAELKENTANRDVLQGSADSGVTAAAAIAALQEAGNKSMRDIVNTSHRAFVRVVRLVIECVRQFYNESRCFRILGTEGYRYLHWSNSGIKEQVTGHLPDGTPLSRRPIFDIDVRAEKQDPYTRYSYNETLKELYEMGVFDPANAAQAKILLDAMEFPGVGKIRQQINTAGDGEAPMVKIIENEKKPGNGMRKTGKALLMSADERGWRVRAEAAGEVQV